MALLGSVANFIHFISAGLRVKGSMAVSLSVACRPSQVVRRKSSFACRPSLVVLCMSSVVNSCFTWHLPWIYWANFDKTLLWYFLHKDLLKLFKWFPVLCILVSWSKGLKMILKVSFSKIISKPYKFKIIHQKWY